MCRRHIDCSIYTRCGNDGVLYLWGAFIDENILHRDRDGNAGGPTPLIRYKDCYRIGGFRFIVKGGTNFQLTGCAINTKR